MASIFVNEVFTATDNIYNLVGAGIRKQIDASIFPAVEIASTSTVYKEIKNNNNRIIHRVLQGV